MTIKKICKGVNLCSYKTEQFKTAVVTLNIIAPIDDKLSERALLINLLARTNKDYPTITEMNRKLASLYGAVISPSVVKTGEAQILRLTMLCVDDRFTFGKESALRSCVELMCDCIFKPDINPQGFLEENLQREKRLLIEKIESEKDDKRIYALNRMTEEMCCDELYGKNKYGTIERINELTGKDIFDEWKRVLFFCPVQVNVVGSASELIIEDTIKQKFEDLQRKDLLTVRTEFLTSAQGAKTITEKQKVKQGKLVIGLRAGMTYDRDNYAAIRLMTAIFGNGTFSKLFMNVREKMSLCYYCSARLVMQKGIIIIESGVETENSQKALDAIRHELDEMRKGNFTDEVMENAKLSIADTMKSIMDSVLSIDSWFNAQCVSGEFMTPEEIVEEVNSVSREEIILAANMVTEDTVFILESENEKEEDE